VKEFQFKHMLSRATETYTEDKLPSWLNHKDYAWFRDQHLLPLEVGASVETDFNTITRIK
jgi:hypothetical protein